MSEENTISAGSVRRGVEKISPTVTPLPVERAPGFALRAAEQTRTALWRSFVGEFPSTPQLALLLVLDEPGPRHQQALANRIAVDKATLTALLATFERRGLSRRSADQRDARRRTVELTVQGRTTALTAMKTVSTVDTELLAPLDPDDRRVVAELWRTVAKTDGSPTPEVAGGLDATPGWWLRRTRQLHSQLWDAYVEDVTPPQYAALDVLFYEGPMEVLTTARRAQLEESNGARILHRLAHRKLISRSAVYEDGRRVQLTITEAGKALLLAATQGVRQVQEAMVSSLDSTQRARFHDLTARVARLN